MEQVKQTAVEWLKGVIESCGKPHELQMSWSTLDEIIEQAKEMEKEQIVNTYRDGRSDQQSEKPSRFYNRMAEHYYNETYGGNK
jgi:hypothetical protein